MKGKGKTLVLSFGREFRMSLDRICENLYLILLCHSVNLCISMEFREDDQMSCHKLSALLQSDSDVW
jgi:hypothetical protein